MDELIKLVSEKTGLPRETAAVAVQTVLGYLRDRLPGPIAGQIDSVVGGAGPKGPEDLLGGMMGKQ